MRNLLLLLTFVIISMGHLSAQESYSLNLRSIVSVYDNVLGEAVEADVDYQLRGWVKTSDIGDYLIQIKFLDDLDPQQHTRKRGKRSRYHYEVQYLTPQYAAKITDRNGHILLNKTYGAETMITPFGKEADISSIYRLQDEWTKERENFYQTQEAKYNNVNDFLTDLAALLDQGLLPPVIVEEALTSTETPSNASPRNEKVIESTIQNNREPMNDRVENSVKNDELNEASDSGSSREEIVNAPQYKLEAIRRDGNQSSTTSTPAESDSEAAITEIEEQNNIDAIIESAESESFDDNVKVEDKATLTESESSDIETEMERPELDDEKVLAPIVVEETKPETALEKRRRLQKEKRAREEWERIEEEDVENAASKSIRPRHVRLGLRFGAPILVGLHAEGVLPILNNRVSIVGDFTTLSLVPIFEQFLDEGEDLEDIDAKYQHYSIGANYYFGKRLARGWYVGASYLKSSFKTDASFSGETVKGEIAFDAAAGRFGINMGRKLIMFGIEVGVAVPFNDIKGTVFYKEDGQIQAEQFSESIPVIPMLNFTLGVAL